MAAAFVAKTLQITFLWRTSIPYQQGSTTSLRGKFLVISVFRTKTVGVLYEK